MKENIRYVRSWCFVHKINSAYFSFGNLATKDLRKSVAWISPQYNLLRGEYLAIPISLGNIGRRGWWADLNLVRHLGFTEEVISFKCEEKYYKLWEPNEHELMQAVVFLTKYKGTEFEVDLNVI